MFNFKLIRDKIPELMAQANETCYYATSESQDLYIGLLRNKLIEETNEFLTSGEVIELVDILTVIKAILKVSNISEADFDKLYQEKLNSHGGFDKKYIGFFQEPDAGAAQPKNN